MSGRHAAKTSRLRWREGERVGRRTWPWVGFVVTLLLLLDVVGLL